VDEDTDVITILCSRCEDLPDPGVTSSRSPCGACGRDVWVAASTYEAIRTHYSDHSVNITCVPCDAQRRGGKGFPEQIEIVGAALPEQIEDLRAYGDSDEVIAYKIAVASVATGTASLEEAEAELLAFPYGERARAFPEAMRRARLMVTATHAPRN
jgi:hypothetical protein